LMWAFILTFSFSSTALHPSLLFVGS
jgi:hypothetical protein